jgi:hypothetical protein
LLLPALEAPQGLALELATSLDHSYLPFQHQPPPSTPETRPNLQRLPTSAHPSHARCLASSQTPADGPLSREQGCSFLRCSPSSSDINMTTCPSYALSRLPHQTPHGSDAFWGPQQYCAGVCPSRTSHDVCLAWSSSSTPTEPVICARSPVVEPNLSVSCGNGAWELTAMSSAGLCYS